jgi:hypothetical protein
MKSKYIIKFSVSLILVLTLLFNVTIPVFAFTSPEKTGNAVEDFFSGLGYTLGFLITAVFVIPILSIPTLIQAISSEPENFAEIMGNYIQDFLSMWGVA